MRTQCATNLELKKWIARHHGIEVESKWIEQCKERFGIAPVAAGEGIDSIPCGPEQQLAIKRAFRHFEMLA